MIHFVIRKVGNFCFTKFLTKNQLQDLMVTDFLPIHNFNLKGVLFLKLEVINKIYFAINYLKSIVNFFIRCLLSLKPHSNQNHRISTLKQQMKSPPYGLNYAFDHAGRKVLTYLDQKMPFNTHSDADRFSYMGSSIPRLQK